MWESICRFAEALRRVLAARDGSGVEDRWTAVELDRLGWDALRRARSRPDLAWEPLLDEIDGLLLRLLDRLPMVCGSDPPGRRVRTFRLPQAERLQHAVAAALVAQRFGPAGLATVVRDRGAPMARRYFAFLALAERHPDRYWPQFLRYLVPRAHHAFVGAAAEAARYYGHRDAARRLVQLFEGVRADLHLRAFLSPRILGSLFVLSDVATLSLFLDLLVTGHTAPDPGRCEVTRALVMVRRFTGRVAPNAKFANTRAPEVEETLDRAEAFYDDRRDALTPVEVLF